MKPTIHILVITTVFLFQSLSSRAAETASVPAPVTVQKPEWNGYQKQSFTLGGVPAYVVVPHIAAPGRPWCWRTSFPDFHSEVDQELLANGWHIAYLDVVEMLGSDASLDLMDQFYTEVRSRYGLAEKMALEPCSRGGLPAYRYAARHPERIACIYGDVPVMDFMSWPGKRAADAPEWQKLLKAYGFASDAEARAYRGNPIDNLEPIAHAGIPLRHVICLTDKVVPPEENTLEAQRRLQQLGGDMELVVVKDSKEFKGHHFPMPEVFESARFVMDHSDVLPKGHEYFQLRDGLNNCREKFATAKTGRIAFLGGSITYNPGWRDELMKYFQSQFPQTKFDFVAAGIPSLGSVPDAFRLERDVLSQGPVDLLFVEAAVNDTENGTSPPEMLRAMAGIVRHTRAANPLTDIIQMHFVDPAHINDYDHGRLPESIAQHEKVAAHYGNPSLNLSEEVTDRINAGEFTWARDFRSVHPSPFGQQLYAISMERMLDAAFSQPVVAVKPHRLPSPLDPFSYANGRFGKLTNARLLKGFTFATNWVPKISCETRPGYVQVPALTATAPGSEFEFAFDGHAAGLMIGAGPDTGIIEVSYDGGPAKKIDTFTPWSKDLYLPWAIILADGLAPGHHTIRVKLLNEHNARSVGTALHVFKLLEN